MNANPTFAIRRGTNISHWLSQSRARGAERRDFFTEEDVRRIAGWGFDHIRIPIDEEQMWDQEGEREPEAFELLQRALDWSESAGLRVIVDLHILRSHHFLNKEPALYSDPDEERRLAHLWEDLSDALAGRASNRVAVELLNEAVARDHEDWNRVAHTAYQAVRRAEPERFIVLGSNRWNQCATFDALRVPDDPRTILTFHFYHPGVVTHYTASWVGKLADYSGPVDYPGELVPEEVFERQPAELKTALDGGNRHYDIDAMRREIAQPLAARERTGLPLYCGEFGAYHKCPDPVRLRWYRDILTVFREHGIAWSNWDYKGGFGIVDRGTGRPTAILDLLTGAAS